MSGHWNRRPGRIASPALRGRLISGSFIVRPVEPSTVVASADLVFADRQVVGKWLKVEATIALSKGEPVVISPELSLHLADLLLRSTPQNPQRP